MRIDLKAFLQAAFGHHDCESGYGAQYPASRDMRAFFAGRIGRPFDGSVIRYSHVDKGDEIQEAWRGPALLLAADLEDLAAQLRELIPTEEDQSNGT